MSQVVGRYAPSPTGPLHFGSLVAALASFCQARGQGGLWRLRIDDIDRPRVVPGAAPAVLRTLARYGLRHDGPVLYQSSRDPAYARAVAYLKAAGQAFDCGCTRREAHVGAMGLEGPIYPGTCRAGLPPGRCPRSVRMAVTAGEIGFVDGVQGRYGQDLARDIGDFVIRRSDGVYAYQLATVVDDAAQGVDEVVRGADLLSSAPRQIGLQRALGLARPRYAHVPVVVNESGEKLGKSTGALALDGCRQATELTACLALLGQRPPPGLGKRSVAGVLRWALDNWSLAAVPARTALTRGFSDLRSDDRAAASRLMATSDGGPIAPGWPSAGR